MRTFDALEDLQRRIQAGYPVLMLRTYEEQRWSNSIADLALELDRGLVSWSITAGPQPPLSSESHENGLALDFLEQITEYPEDHLFLVKDLHPFLNDPAVVRKIRDMLDDLVRERKSLLLMSPVEEVPIELLKDVFVLDLPLPGPDEIREVLETVLHERPDDISVRPDARQEDHIISAVLGLTASEIRHALAQTLSGREEIDEDVYAELVAEKRRMVQGSNLLEFFDLDEDIKDVGGLEGLKAWIVERSEAFTSDAQTQGISNPKGVLLAGVQGCGKSLSAKAIARLLGFPLVRLDMGNLLESARGSSEQNLRDVLQLMETISPAVMWMEEIDKAFAGFTDEATTDATMSRILGRFLTWLQEHTSPVFVVATANNVTSLPPEMLRRGRFDELFFVDLPNFHERKAIFEIHLQKRGWKPEKFDIEGLANETEGYSGAEIEQIVNSAIIEAHAQNRMPSQEDLDAGRERTVPLSVTMEDEIFRLREWARTRCRPATIDYRVIQVMEEEERRGEAPEQEKIEVPKWIQLAEHGQIQAAIVEHIRLHDHVNWEQLSRDLKEYTPTSGEYGLVLRSDPQVVIWNRMSRTWADMLSSYLNGKRFYLHPVPADEFTGPRPQLPVLETLPDERIDRPVWFPTKFRLLPPATGSGRLGRVARIRMKASS